jgi:hypothetical protein
MICISGCVLMARVLRQIKISNSDEFPETVSELACDRNIISK